MNWKGPLLVFSIMLTLIIAYTTFSTHMHNSNIQTKLTEGSSFGMSVKEYGLIDSGDGIRGFAIADIMMTGADNANASLIMLPKSPFSDIYEVDDYPTESEKHDILERAESELREYDIQVQPISAEEAMSKSGSVIIVPSDAMPD